MSSLTLKLESHFQNRAPEKIKVHRVLIFRKDGLILFNNNNDNNLNFSTQGALSTGAWQAAFSLFKSLEKESSREENFRFSFDTSSYGIHILPIRSEEELVYGGIIFRDETNPAQIKNLFRNYVRETEEIFINETKEIIETLDSNSEVQRDFLFKDISDDEIDKLFSFAGE